jgi:GTP-binding protein EngB required for normal cell division
MSSFKNKSRTDNPEPSYIKIDSIYLESKTAALQLISRISEGRKDNNIANWFNKVDHFVSDSNDKTNLREYLSKIGRGEVIIEILNKINDLKINLETIHTSNFTNVAVAGAFSSGKSSFLNSLLFTNESEVILPCDLTPTSVIPTYIYCKKEFKKTIIKGENKNQALINLDQGILAAISHNFESAHNIKLSNFLDKIILEIPNTKLDGFAFIDTPGYDKAENENNRNSKTDKETAKQEIKKGDVLFWIISSDKPTITKEDLELIRSFDKAKPKLIVLNKADKIDNSEHREIIQKIAKSLNANNDKSIVDIIAYSSKKKELIYSYRNLIYADIFDKIRSTTVKSNIEDQCISFISETKVKLDLLFNSIKLDDINQELRSINSKIDSKFRSEKDFSEVFNILKSSEELAILNINTLKELWTKMFNLSSDGLFREKKWLVETNWISNSLQVNKLSTEKLKDSILSMDYYREFLNIPTLNAKPEIFKELGKILDSAEKIENDNSYLLKRKSILIKRSEKLTQDLKEREQLFSKLIIMINAAVYLYKQYFKNNQIQNEFSKTNVLTNVFNEIKSGNFERFLECFSSTLGVNQYQKNLEGFTPVTYAISRGEKQMVAFFISKNVDLLFIDGRNKNALDTAEEFRYNSIIDLLETELTPNNYI